MPAGDEQLGAEVRVGEVEVGTPVGEHRTLPRGVDDGDDHPGLVPGRHPEVRLDPAAARARAAARPSSSSPTTPTRCTCAPAAARATAWLDAEPPGVRAIREGVSLPRLNGPSGRTTTSTMTSPTTMTTGREGRLAAPAREAPRPEQCNVDGVPTGGDSAVLGAPGPVPDCRSPTGPCSGEAADAVAARAYAPYSGLRVGAAGLCDDGHVVTGCNVENASFGLTLCAECGLVSALVAGGHSRLVAVSVTAGDGRPLAPCGRCRQLLMEHGGPDLLVDGGPAAPPQRLGDLLPGAFDRVRAGGPLDQGPDVGQGR